MGEQSLHNHFPGADMQDRITRELNYLRYKMLEKIGSNPLFGIADRDMIMSALKEVIDEMEQERLTMYGLPFSDPTERLVADTYV
jgi:hypothetical protein